MKLVALVVVFAADDIDVHHQDAEGSVNGEAVHQVRRNSSGNVGDGAPRAGLDVFAAVFVEMGPEVAKTNSIVCPESVEVTANRIRMERDKHNVVQFLRNNEQTKEFIAPREGLIQVY